MQRNSLYPYIVAKEYLRYRAEKPEAKSLGQDTYEVLVKDLDGLVGNVTSEELNRLNLTPAEADTLAIGNLENLFISGEIKARLFPSGLEGKPFILVGGHWAAAGCILLSKLVESARRNLGSQNICFSVPHREALLIFPKGDRNYRNAMRTLIKEKEGNGSKPITFGLFAFEEGRIVQ